LASPLKIAKVPSVMDPIAPENTQALLPGTRLEEFEIERVLGAGGFGITYLARDTSLGRHVVIKENLPVQFAFRDTHSLTVSPRHTIGENADNFAWSMENFSKEAALLASLDHPGIVKVLRSFRACGTAFFVMPYVDGVPLDELAKSREGKSFSEEELRGMTERVLAALAYLHDRGIYHRDIKPGNILITNEGIPVLIDFGSARQRLSERSMTVVESPGYTPFEQLQSRGNVGPWSDVYALGATIAKLITGENLPKAMDRVMDDPWPPLASRPDLLRSYSHGFLSSLDRAFACRIEERWQDAGEWFTEIRATSGEAGHEIASAANRGPANATQPPPPVSPPPLPPQAEDFNPPAQSSSSQAKRQSTKLYAGVAAAVILAIILISVLFVATNHTAQSRVRVTSDPIGAEVIFNGVVVGQTPWVSGQLPAGSTVNYTLRKSGWTEQEVSVPVVPRRIQEVEGKLTIDAFYAERADESELLGLAEEGDAYAQALLGFRKYFGPHQGMNEAQRKASEAEGIQWLEKSANAEHPVGLAALALARFWSDDDEKESKAQRYQQLAVKAGLLDELEKRGPYWRLFAGLAYADGAGVEQNSTEAVNLIRSSAELGLALAQFFMGHIYSEGISVNKDDKTAFEWYLKASNLGDLNAIIRLADYYSNGIGIAVNYMEALRWYQEAAELGDIHAMKSIGHMYDGGVGVAKNETEAVKWWRMAAARGDTEAMTELGLCYEIGAGVTKDEREAVKWYRKAADQGYAEAQAYLGDAYWYGQGVTQDRREAVKWYRLSADQANQDAQTKMGIAYWNGEGLNQDRNEAFKWYNLAAEQGDAFAQNELASIYWSGELVNQNYQEAIKWLRKAADQGYAPSQSSLGFVYWSGQGVNKNRIESVKWYKLAAAQGHADAQVSIGHAYELGEGVEKNAQEAVKWYRLAADQGNPDGQFDLGNAYWNGNGVHKDPQEAVKWLRLAAEQRHPTAQNNLGVAYQDGLGLSVDMQEAVKWYRLAADQGNAMAQYHLGGAYLQGTGVPQNKQEAIKWLRLAADQGHEAAKKALSEIR